MRFGPHSKGDDTRPEDLVQQLWEKRDPLCIHGSRLFPVEKEQVESEVAAEVSQAFEQALSDPAAAFKEEPG